MKEVSELDRYRSRLIDLDRTDDDYFLEWYRNIRPALLENNSKLTDYFDPDEEVEYTYTQQWAAYDQAKTNEETLFKRLLEELLFLADLKEEESRGRKGFSIKDKILALVLKVYYQNSMRRTVSVLRERLPNAPCFKSITNFFNEPRLADELDRLIMLSALPLIGLEEVAAVDSSGFSLSKYAQWHEYKWGKHTGKERIWRKAHINCGTRTNIILSAKLSPKSVADCPVFPILAVDAKQFYDIKEITADKAYLSRENLNFAFAIGMIPFIPFKSNSTSSKKGSWIWGKMYELFKNREKEFNRHYHKRSNVETCFHMLKQRFGNNLTTKTKYANAVELKVKVLCHNLCVLIQEAFESDVRVDFSDCVKMYEQRKKSV